MQSKFTNHNKPRSKGNQQEAKRTLASHERDTQKIVGIKKLALGFLRLAWAQKRRLLQETITKSGKG